MYRVVCLFGEKKAVERAEIIKFDYENDTPAAEADTIPFGTHVLADSNEDDVDGRFFFVAQILDRHKDGRHKIYFLADGTYDYLSPNQIAPTPFGTFKSPSDAKMFSSCDEFYKQVTGERGRLVYQREIGSGCLAAISWPEEGGEDTTLVATYDGQIHMDFNAYSSASVYETQQKASLVNFLTEQKIEGTDRTQTDFHPRGYGRVINFRHESNKDSFLSKYPRKTIGSY